MKFSTLLGLSTLLVAAVAISGCRSRYEWRQKLTVTVDTPAGERSGSSVSQIVALFGQLPTSGNEVEYTLHGEATIVEVSPGRFLFALLDDGTKELAAAAWKDELPRLRRDWLPRIDGLEGERELSTNVFPRLVTFQNARDPKSVREVKPNDIPALFGPGISLKSITLSISSEQVTKGRAGKVLPWLATIGNGMLDGSRVSSLSAPNRLANELSRLNFERD